MLVLERVSPGERLRILVNFSGTEGAALADDAQLLLRTSRGAAPNVLAPGEAVIISLPSR